MASCSAPLAPALWQGRSRSPGSRLDLASDALAAGATIGTAIAMILFGVARHPATALCASLIAGASWIAVLSSLNVSAQVALSDLVRGRGLAIYSMAFFGALTLGSAI